MLYGYIRVSKLEQNEHLQVDALKKLHCDKIFIEKVSGVAKDRKEWIKLNTKLESGDTVVVWDISRLGRSSKEMFQIVEDWANKGILFKSVQEPFIDTTTEAGDFILKLFILIAEQERKRIRRRTLEGIAAARARGRNGGRPAGLSPKAITIAKTAKVLYDSKNHTVKEICEMLNIRSKSTLYKYIRYTDSQISE